jgi:hypothetical protein
VRERTADAKIQAPLTQCLSTPVTPPWNPSHLRTDGRLLLQLGRRELHLEIFTRQQLVERVKLPENLSVEKKKIIWTVRLGKPGGSVTIDRVDGILSHRTVALQAMPKGYDPTSPSFTLKASFSVNCLVRSACWASSFSVTSSMAEENFA